MKKCLPVFWLLLFCSLSAFAQNLIQMPLPPQNTTFSGNVRGYWFTSPTCFTITGVEVPTDASSGAQNIAVVRLNAPPPLYSTTTNDFTVLYLTQNNPATGIIPLSIEVGVGDVIGILGNRADVNSYGTSPSPSTINGFPVTLTRLGMQFNLSTTAPQDLWTENAGSVSRVWMYYDTTFTFTVNQVWTGGTTYSFSNGASASATSVWDYGDGSPLDTAYNPSHTFPAPGNYNVCSYITGTCASDTVCTTVIICPAPALADYTYSITYPSVSFTDNSQNAASWSWDFGDGNSSTQQSPTHSYATFGLYTVCLSVTDTCGGVHTRCENISVCPAVIPVSLGSDVTACGSTVVSLPGFTTYTWSNGATTAQITVNNSGTYSVVVTDAAGCSGTDTLNVSINPLPAANLGNDITQCGGPVILDPQSPGNTYQWNNGATTQSISVNNSGTYTVTVTDGIGCTNIDDITITVLPVPPSALGPDINICQTTISISVQTSAGSTYLWNTGSTLPSILISTTGTYWVRVTGSNGCSSSDTINVVMNAPAVTYVETQTLVCINAAAFTLAPGTPAGGSYSGPGVSGNTFDPALAGLGNKNVIYSWLDSISGCTGRDTSVITVDPCSGIGELNDIGLQFYPNPGSGLFNVSFTGRVEELLISDAYGKVIERILPSGNKLVIDLSRHAEGMYLLRAKEKDKDYTLPFMIAR